MTFLWNNSKSCQFFALHTVCCSDTMHTVCPCVVLGKKQQIHCSVLYHLFINVIYFSISFFNSNIHKILTVCKKTWFMAHQRTVTKNRYIFFIIKAKDTVCIHRRSEHKKRGRAQSRCSRVIWKSASEEPQLSPRVQTWNSPGSLYVTTPVASSVPCAGH